jgi:arylsulfatase A
MTNAKTHRWTFICWAVVMSAAVRGLSADRAAAQPGENTSRPNIIVILADDLGYADLACYGGKIPTPYTDRLAKDGRRFTDAHTPTAVCSPTRYALLTGQCSWRTPMGTGIVGHNAPLSISTERLTIAKLLQQKGYATGAFGKWHLGIGIGRTDWNEPLKPGPCEVGFDHYFGIPTSHNWGPFVWVEDHHIVNRPDGLKIDQNTRPPAPAGRVDADVGLVLSERVAKFIEKNKDRPFFVYYPTPQVHDPYTPNARFQGKSGRKNDRMHGDWVVEWDWCVGQVMETLDRLNLAENTLLIVTSDNGGVGADSSGPLRAGKTSIYEGGHRVPFLVRWPGHVPASTTCDETICLTDMLATFAALHNVQLPDDAGEDSYNIVPALLGQKLDRPIREATMFLGRAIRQGPWKLILPDKRKGSTGEM